MKKATVATGTLVLALSLAGSAFAAGNMTMPLSSSTGSSMTGMNMTAPAPSSQGKVDGKAVDALFASAFDGLKFDADQAMQGHDIIAAMAGSMDELAKQIDASSGAEKDLKSQEMMLMMQKAQVDLEGVLDDNQAQLLGALVLGEFPDSKAYPSDKAQVSRLKAAAELRKAVDDHDIAHRTVELLAKMMPDMSGMNMGH